MNSSGNSFKNCVTICANEEDETIPAVIFKAGAGRGPDLRLQISDLRLK